MMSIIHTASTKTTAMPSEVRRAACAANSSMYTVMIMPAISGSRFMSRKILMLDITSSKKGAEESTATATANIGTSARSVV